MTEEPSRAARRGAAAQIPPAASAAGFPAALSAILALPDGPRLVAIDGRCGSGKTALAQLLAERGNCTVLHMDDYYLPPDSRSPGWERTPGGNMDFARLRREALDPARRGEPLRVRPYRCREGRFGPEETIFPGKLTVVEGSYACHPALGRYDLRIFLTCGKSAQEQRLRRREGSRFDAFRETWIPLEEAYFAAFDVEASCDLRLDTTGLF